MTPNEYFLKEAKKELAFTCDGVPSYQFAENGIPHYYMRFYKMQERLEIQDMFKLGQTEVNELFESLKSAMDSGKMTEGQKVDEFKRLINFYDWRRSQSNNLTTMYELMTVWHFDECENPREYDETYAKVKIKRWMNNNEAILPNGEKINLMNFFLNTPLNRFIDFQSLSKEGMATYLKKLYETALSHSMLTLYKHNLIEEDSLLKQTLDLSMETYKGLINLLHTESSNTMTS